MNWYATVRQAAINDVTITGPTDGSGHMTGDDKALIWTAVIGGENVGYILVVFPPNRPPSVGQVTIKPELRRQGIAWRLYRTVDEYLKQQGLPPLRPSRDLSPGSRGLWDRRFREGIG